MENLFSRRYHRCTLAIPEPRKKASTWQTMVDGNKALLKSADEQIDGQYANPHLRPIADALQVLEGPVTVSRMQLG